ncbi:hypothetical protein [Cognatishimia activa]|uniref:Lipoprotein n=1 Tax=Cognatishimia activa TaxID=1715691 RepID=A0A975I6Z1_9RHOB|nr:hypothetical protein [Cognatishimia activa]QTN35608.1 hypothetical protein HZ995_14170 [Cognatishimia activa]
MKKTIGLLLIATLTLSACGRVRDSAINPFNWFGGSETVETTAEEVNPLIPQERESLLRRPEAEYAGTLVADLTTLKIERVAGGAIIRVKGIASTQGAFDVRMEPENEDQEPVKGVLTYTLLAVQPPGFRQGPAQSREITAAVFRTDQELANVRTIRVVGANKTLQSRR